MDAPDKALKEGLAELFKNERFSDFTITCGPYKFKVHKAVLSTQTGYFTAAAGSFKEGQDNAIYLAATGSGPGDDDSVNDDPEAVKHMVHYFYHLDYQADLDDVTDPEMSTDQLEDPSMSSNKRKRKAFVGKGPSVPLPQQVKADGDIVMHAKVFTAAVKYQIPALKALAASKFTTATKSNWDHVSFAQAVHIVYTTTPDDVRDLRSVVVNTLATQNKLLDKDEIRTVVLDINVLGWELLRKSRGLPALPGEEDTCQSCGEALVTITRECDNCSNYFDGCQNRCERCPHCGSRW